MWRSDAIDFSSCHVMSVYNILIYCTSADIPAVHCQCLVRDIHVASLSRSFRGRIRQVLKSKKRGFFFLRRSPNPSKDSIQEKKKDFFKNVDRFFWLCCKCKALIRDSINWTETKRSNKYQSDSSRNRYVFDLTGTHCFQHLQRWCTTSWTLQQLLTLMAELIQ